MPVSAGRNVGARSEGRSGLSGQKAEKPGRGAWAALEKLPELRPDIFQATPSYVGVEELGASSVDMKVVAKVLEPNVYFARRIMNRELKLALDAAGIESLFPQVVVHHQVGK